jgi:hypothetical protein
MVEIGDQTCHGCQHRPGEGPKTVERCDLMQGFEAAVAFVASKFARGARNGTGRRIGQCVADHDLARPQPRQGCTQPLGSTFLQLHPTGRDVTRGDPANPAHLAYRGEQIGPARFEQGLLGQRSGSDEADDVACHQCLGTTALPGLFRAFGLLGDRDPAARLDKPGEIPLRRMDRNPAHRDRHAKVLASAGQRDVEDLGGRPCIIEEQLEEIAHPVKQQAIGRLGLERQILRHHRGCRWRGGRSVHRGGLAFLKVIREALQPSFPLSRRAAIR